MIVEKLKLKKLEVDFFLTFFEINK